MIFVSQLNHSRFPCAAKGLFSFYHPLILPMSLFSSAFSYILSLALTSIVQQGGSADGIDPLTLRNRLDALTAQQAELLDKVLEDMENEELNAQLKATMEEKQAILGRLGALQQDEEQRAGQEARLRELAEWLKQQKSEFTEYDDTITRRYVERITVVDAETIRIKFRYTDVEIDRAVRT